MPIYEYYCPACESRFNHLARHYDEAPPPCPGCDSHQVEKLVSRVHTGRSEAERRADFGSRSREVDQEDPREMARFLQDAGSLADEVAPVEREVFREIVARREEGASDEDLQDVTDAISLPSREEMMRLHEHKHEGHEAHHERHEGHCEGHEAQHEGHEAHHEGHEHEHEGHECHEHGPAKKRSPRRARDLGWA